VSAKLIILGMLMEGEKHPYEIQQIMDTRNMNRYIKLPKGSLYYAFEHLQKGGYIEVSGVFKDSARPDRTVYRITETGREKFHELLIKQYAVQEEYFNPLYAALAFARFSNKDEIAPILELK